MGSKNKEVIAARKNHIEKKLKERLALLAGKGVATERSAKDALVRKMRSQLKELAARGKAVAAIEKRTEDLARQKAEKIAAAKEMKEDKKKEPKAAAKEGKGKEAKESTGKGKEKKKKKAEAEEQETTDA